MNSEIKKVIIEKLSDLPVYSVNDDGTEHMIRCPYCGDSVNPTHFHMGVKIDLDSDEGMPFYCFRCGASGKVTDDFLEDLGIYISDEEMKELRNYNKKAEKRNPKRTIIKSERFVVPLCEPTPLNEKKRAYISERLGLIFSYEELQQCKIVPSLYAFLLRNEIQSIQGVEKWVIDAMEKDYVGFLSTNNNLLTFRNINPESKGKRYYKLFINPLNQSNASFYSIPTQLDLMYADDLHVHIAEGTFDILSVKFNLPHEEPGHHIFYASCGYSYVNIIKHLIRSGICTHLNIHIYADKDKSDSDHRKLIKKSSINEFMEHIWIHRNGYYGEKDYGVPRDRIMHKTRQLW